MVFFVFLFLLNWGLPFPVTYRALDIIWLHGFVNSILFGVLLFVFLIMLGLCKSKYYFNTTGLVYRKSEIFCTLIPICLLLLQLSFSLQILYRTTSLDLSPSLTVKIVGHQWYWEYDYSDIAGLVFDSFILDVEDLELGDPRLLSVDNRIVVPCGVNIRLCVTSADVIHSWSLPGAGLKIDAVPGVLSVTVVNFPVVGVFYGQCSEICGANHSFMPICVEVTPWEMFGFWARLYSD